ncbi:hypothetical protein SAMN04488540_10672 [Ferrimonas sediminum]|uniref:Uncharacterized protein n=1 Tax=Ferrimonas sediminum TaxID=718193 RepID=A0A1G8S4X7_9GAMM|nr:hypothetical protein [Ferrimonas sediminum]SDJ24267.1 hypothetical protein SAMN04488540_10672 [Ferrimonas sediminum]
MSMKSAKEFAVWMKDRFGSHPQGLYLTKADIRELSGRQTFRQDFIADVHFELCRHGMGFITDALKENYFLIHLPNTYWKEVSDRYAAESNVHAIPFSQQKQR